MSYRLNDVCTEAFTAKTYTWIPSRPFKLDFPFLVNWSERLKNATAHETLIIPLTLANNNHKKETP